MSTQAETATAIVDEYERELVKLTKAYGGGWTGLGKASNAARIGLAHRIAEALHAASLVVSLPRGLVLTGDAPAKQEVDDYPVVAPRAPLMKKKATAAEPTKSYVFQKRKAPPRDELQALINEGYSISKLTIHYRAKPLVIKRWFAELNINYTPPAQVSQKRPMTEQAAAHEGMALGVYDDGNTDQGELSLR